MDGILAGNIPATPAFSSCSWRSILYVFGFPSMVLLRRDCGCSSRPAYMSTVVLREGKKPTRLTSLLVESSWSVAEYEPCARELFEKTDSSRPAQASIARL